MSVRHFHEIVRFLSGLEPIQIELEKLYEGRLKALTTVESGVLHDLVAEEKSIQKRLRQHLQRRAAILHTARREGLAADNLRRLLRDLSRFIAPHGEIDGQQYEQAVAWMKRVEHRSWELRRLSWVNWHVVRRGCREFTEIRDLIANCGERPSDAASGPRASLKGGALIDTSV